MILAVDIIATSPSGGADHAFPEDNKGRAVWRARCPLAILGDRVTKSSNTTPTCPVCQPLWLDAIVKQGEVVAAHLESTYVDLNLGVASNDASG